MTRGGPIFQSGLALVLAGTVAAHGQPPGDGVPAEGLLSNDDFFRLVTCAAPPGESCRVPILRWGKRDLTLALLPGRDPAPPGFADRLGAAIDRALMQINTAGSGIRIRRTDAPVADIRVFPTALTEGTVLSEEPGFLAAGIMGVGYMTVWADDDNQITDAVILMSTSISDADLPSVMLEEIMQSLGPRFDIENPAYDGRSILSQSSNLTTTITGQDAALLRWLYPPEY